MSTDHSSRAEALAAEVERTHAAFADYLSTLSAEQWQTSGVNHPEIAVGEDEHRMVGVIDHHVGDTIHLFTERALLLANGAPIEPMTLAAMDAANARHAALNANPDQAETIALIRDNAGQSTAQIRALSDEQLTRPGKGPLADWTAETLVRRVLIGHVATHEGSIRAAIGS